MGGFYLLEIVARSKLRKWRKSRKKQLNKVIVLSTTENKEIYAQKPIWYSPRRRNYQIQIFRDFRVFVLSPTPKKENSEVKKFLQKHHNTVIWGYSFKCLKYVQLTSNSKWFNHIVDHVAGICLLRASDLSKFIEFVFAKVIFDTQKVKIVIMKQIHMHFSFITPK